MFPLRPNDEQDQARLKRQQVAGSVAIIASTAAQLLKETTKTLLVVTAESEETRIDGRSVAIRKKKRIKYDHKRAQMCVVDDYLGRFAHGIIPRFNGRQFEVMFRVHPWRYEHIRYMIGEFGSPFFRSRTGASMDCRILLAMKTLGYGVAAHCFGDYFQMSPQLCRDCLIYFCRDVKNIFQAEFLRCPSSEDMKNIVAYHKAVHKMPGMLGSLDCTHTTWKNCPKAFHGSYMGKSRKPTIVLEAVCDYNLWFWHVSYGYCGSMNDINILNLSPLLERMLDGTFDRLEDEADDVVPYTIGGEEFNKAYFLTDGIYPRYSRFVKGMKVPITEEEKRFTGWQESARKDIERAFGVLKEKFQFVSRPIKLHSINEIAERIACCLILHNIAVMDRTTDQMPGGRYNPLKALTCHTPRETPANVPTPNDRAEKQHSLSDSSASGLDQMPEVELRNWATQRGEAWKCLKNKPEHARLQKAMIASFKKDD